MRPLSMMLGIAALVMWAATASAGTIRGEVLDVSGDEIKIKTADGQEKTLELAPTAREGTSGVTLGDQIVAELDNKGKATSIEKETGAGSPARPDMESGSPPPAGESETGP